jgi:serine/threonine protein kinase/Tol biopolymer transport system component
MTPERWQQIEKLYHDALEVAAVEREALLARADPELRREVESLLEQESSKENALDYPAWEGAAGAGLADSTVTVFTSGTQLGPYKIEGQLGIGGMGEVFRAVDTRLGRAVAIKTSQERFSERFEREARAISSLNHPHICTLYDVGPNYLVMELVEGETLAARLKRGKLPLADTLKYGAQIADALSAAHAKGITHRDLKPANIMLGKLGIKVLDFGLARSAVDATLTAPLVVMGTPAYMAPEQREGKDCDARTDIYALGLILYEMATGKRAPQGEMPILDVLPPQLEHVVELCLAQDPEDRWQASRDVQRELEWCGKQSSAPPNVHPPSRAWIWGATAIAATGLIVAGWLSSRRGAVMQGARAAEFTLSFTEQTSGAADNRFPMPSPDGRYVVFGGTTKEGSALWLRAIDSGEAHPIPGTEGAVGGFWSPDSRWIGFYVDKKLKKIGVSGGAAETIASLPGFQDPVWGTNGDIIYRPTNRAPLWRIGNSAGPATQLTELDTSQTENSHRAPRFLPDGRRFLFTSRCGQRDNNALYIGSLDTPKKVRRLMPAQANVAYVEGGNGHEGLLLFYRDGGIWAQPFDAGREQLSGRPFVVAGSVAYNAASIHARYAASADGSLIVLQSPNSLGTRFNWFRRDGELLGTLAGAVGFQPRISPQGDRVVFAGVDPQSGNRDLFSVELARGVISRLTIDVANDWFPVWAPDGSQLLFGSDRAGGADVTAYLKKSMDPGRGETAFQTHVTYPVDWSRDGRWIAFQSSSASATPSGDISIASTVGDRKPFVYLGTPFRQEDPRFSPDGRWIAYSSDESGRYEVYARPFTGEPASAKGKIQLSNAGGDFPVWRADGRELFYMTRDGSIYAVESGNLGKTGAAPVPVRLFRACPDSAPLSPAMTGQSYDYAFDTRDGQRFLLNCMNEPPGKFSVLLNWPLVAKP